MNNTVHIGKAKIKMRVIFVERKVRQSVRTLKNINRCVFHCVKEELIIG